MTTVPTSNPRRTYLTVAIPYVNAAPHLGYAFELVEADVVARARRATGEDVRFLGGTDDHSLKNVLAAESAGVTPTELVAANGRRFESLAAALDIGFDDFIRTSTDPRHRPGVERLWSACAANGDLYRRSYEGRYCVGCEQFYEPDALPDGRCPEHDRPLDLVAEENWFFRLSRHADEIGRAIRTGRLTVEPRIYRDEILGFLDGAVHDVSVSRTATRARGWGIPVPGDPGQVIAVWFDALANYVSALGYGTNDPTFDRWWHHSDERIHVVGKGIVRFHAVHWPAFLLSAGLDLPTRIQVHPYLSVDGAKISKSAGPQLDPVVLTEAVGADALRWWFTRVPAVTADTDLRVDRLIAVANDDLANGLGNTVHRIATLRRRAGLGEPAPVEDRPGGLVDRVRALLTDFDRRRAADRIVSATNTLNRAIELDQPWVLARDPGRHDELVARLDEYADTAHTILDAAAPVVPTLARTLAAHLAEADRSSPPVPRLAPV